MEWVGLTKNWSLKKNLAFTRISESPGSFFSVWTTGSGGDTRMVLTTCVRGWLVCGKLWKVVLYLELSSLHLVSQTVHLVEEQYHGHCTQPPTQQTVARTVAMGRGNTTGHSPVVPYLLKQGQGLPQSVLRKQREVSCIQSRCHSRWSCPP